jgi:asparagine synthase (glutamine-hydrolysing)
MRGGERDIAKRQYQWMTLAPVRCTSAVKQTDIQQSAVNRVTNAQTEATAILPANRQDDLAIMQMTDARFALPDGILAKVDRASMLNSLEVRVPFLDTDVFEFAMGIPTSQKITPTEQKVVLKKAFDDILPKEILSRGKQGFDVPIGEWFKNELKSEFTQTISESKTDMIDTEFVWKLYREHTNGLQDHTQFLWTVYVFLRWHKQMCNQGVL